MPIKFGAVLCCMLITLTANAQQLQRALPPADSAGNIPIAANPLMRRIIMDSLNRYKDRLKGQPGISRPEGPAAVLNGLNEPVKQQFLSYIQKTSGPEKAKQLKEGFSVLKDTARMQQFVDEKLRGFYALFKDDPNFSKLALPGKIENKFSGAKAETSFGDTTGNGSGWWSNVNVQDRFSAGSIPVNLQYANVSGYSRVDTRLEDDNLVKFNFDKEAYLKKIDAHVKKNYDLKKYFLDDIDFRGQLQSFVSAKMKSFDQLGDSLSGMVKPEQVIYLDSIQLRNVLNENALKEPARRMADSSLDKYMGRLMDLKKELGGGLEIKDMLNSQHTVRNNLGKWINDPASTARMAQDLVPMSGLQRFFMKVKDLNLGNIAANASKGTVSDLFMTGMAGSLLSKNNYLMTAIGKTREIRAMDAGLDATMNAPAKSLQFVRLGKGDLGNGHSHLSVLNANSRNEPGRAPNVRALMQNTFVGAVSKQISLGEYGQIAAELSKSANRTGGAGPSADHAAMTKAAVANFFDDFFVTLSTGVSYTGSVREWGTTHKVYFNYSGLGYNNPGNPYARRGMIQYGLNLKRSWLKNRAVVQLRTDVKNMERSAVSGSQWKNYNFSLDGRYRLSRKLTLSGRLMQSQMNTVSDKYSDAVFTNRKISFSSSWNGKTGRLPFFNQASLGLQQMHYITAAEPVKSLFVNTQVSHTIPVNGKMIAATIFYNRDLKNAAVYSNLLNMDAGYHYTLLKILQCGSSLTFLDNKDVVRQIGVRQQASAQLLKRWNVNLSVDARKDLVTSAQNYLYGNFRTELSLHYQLN
ncbi:hypothetical protein ACFOTA_17740 [Chitinophaga sp. GCM10012297]|uniref:Uncharacterized protein n=1 Tax=Chitinophaga chungangae TaxID=2821488 RepID=A0ABS3YHA2_9BACT|nr:hypothetical protein [Chitinophaga chungangae]MBO9154066.1 hypothetical protein [Chitinophaga chungangae]